MGWPWRVNSGYFFILPSLLIHSSDKYSHA